MELKKLRLVKSWQKGVKNDRINWNRISCVFVGIKRINFNYKKETLSKEESIQRKAGEEVENEILISFSKSSEFVDKSISRRIPVPFKADVNKVQVTVINGLITIKFSKKEEFLPKHLDVE